MVFGKVGKSVCVMCGCYGFDFFFFTRVDDLEQESSLQPVTFSVPRLCLCATTDLDQVRFLLGEIDVSSSNDINMYIEIYLSFFSFCLIFETLCVVQRNLTKRFTRGDVKIFYSPEQELNLQTSRLHYDAVLLRYDSQILDVFSKDQYI